VINNTLVFRETESNRIRKFQHTA